MRMVILCTSIVFFFAQVRAIPPGGDNVISTDINNFSLQGSDGSMRIVSVSGQPFTEAIEVTTTSKPANDYLFQLNTPTITSVAGDDILLGIAYLRAIESSVETGEVKVGFIFEKAGTPYTKSASMLLRTGSDEWKTCYIPFQCSDNYAAGDAQVNLKCGYDPQTVEIGGVKVLNYRKTLAIDDLPRTQVTYPGMEPDAPWRAEAEDRIRQYRTGMLDIRVNDGSGDPVPGARVEVEMKQHTFGFGSAVVCGTIMDPNSQNAATYREWIVKLFNRVVIENELKWSDWAWENMGQRQRTLDGLAWLNEQGIDVRGHCLIWPSWRHMPSDAEALAGNPDALRTRINEHITEEVTVCKEYISEWDVINEPYTNHDVMDILGNDEMVEWFKRADNAAPETPLYINDYAILSSGGDNTAHQDHYYNTIKFLKDNGAPIDGIGLQSHFGSDLTPPARLWSVLQRFDSLGLSMQSTEFDINLTDDSLKAHYLRDFMTVLYSHPSITGIIMWGFWAGRHWRPDAALFDEDWTLREHGEAWIDLVKNQWWTDTVGTTDSEGKLSVRCYNGTYKISCTHGDFSMTIDTVMTGGGLSLQVSTAAIGVSSAIPEKLESGAPGVMKLQLTKDYYTHVPHSGNGTAAVVHVQVFDQKGRVVYRRTLDSVPNTGLELVSMAPGVYFLRIYSGGQNLSRRIVVGE
ncbi:MAG: T9SS type A sorting domain-containing protein [Chitinivibrionales bacterium]|nr:T9SS type A sorting domain-containing protein [Chitinivibrionales bacterium]